MVCVASQVSSSPFVRQACSLTAVCLRMTLPATGQNFGARSLYFRARGLAFLKGSASPKRGQAISLTYGKLRAGFPFGRDICRHCRFVVVVVAEVRGADIVPAAL